MKRTGFLPVVVLVAVGVVSVFALAPVVLAEDSPEAAEATSADGIVAFYFHGNARCVTCKKIEAYADEAIAQGFPEELASGQIEWRPVNIDEADNKHFIEDFQLVTKSVVLVEYHDGAVTRWQNLDKVWQLVRNKDNFVGYVQEETREFLGTS